MYKMCNTNKKEATSIEVEEVKRISSNFHSNRMVVLIKIFVVCKTIHQNKLYGHKLRLWNYFIALELLKAIKF